MQFRIFVRGTIIGEVNTHVCSDVVLVVGIREVALAISGSLGGRTEVL
jgi:hypothetical protein